MSWIVYKHTSPTNKVYIGITGRSPLVRWNNGKGYLNTKKGKFNQPIMANAIIKYGWDNFTHEILYTGLSKKEAAKIEIELIKYYKDRGLSYNITDGGEGFLGFSPSKEIREKISKAKKGKSTKLKGHKMSEETKQKLREKALKRKVSQEVIDNLIKCNIGKKHTKEQNTKIGKNNPRCKKIIKLDNNYNIVDTYFSIGEASKINNIPFTTLKSHCLNNKALKGYYWRIEEE